MDQPGTGHFGDRLIGRTRRVGHPLCVGLDPYLDRIPALFAQGSMAPGDPATAVAVTGFLTAVIDRLPGRVAAVKPQMALFEVMGWRGLRALEQVVDHARARGLLVLLDGKRGDIGATAAGYAQAYLGPDAAIAGDALTVNPFLGPDTLEPFVTGRAGGRGLFVLVRTSNPGSAHFQDIETGDGPFHHRIARELARLVEAERGPATGWSAVGAVVGATWPDQARRLRRLLPNAPFLIPGYGAQGGGAGAALAGLVAGPHGLEGGLVNTARAVLFPPGAESAATATAWERAIDDTLSRAIGELQAAMAVAATEPAAAG